MAMPSTSRALPVSGYVAAGEVALQIDGGGAQTFSTGQTYYQLASRPVRMINTSSSMSAKIVNFYFGNGTPAPISTTK